jgi:tetratricopeptide (TPR) repeat protein
LLSGWSWYGSNNFKNGIAQIDKLSGPDWYGLYKDLHAGLILDLANQRADALKRIERVRSVDPNSLRNVEAYARMLSRAGRDADAEKAYSNFSTALVRHPLVDSALAELKTGAKLAPLAANAATGAAEALYGLGAALSQEPGGEDLGMVYLQLAIYLNPEHPLALVALGTLFESTKKYESAVDTYERVPENSPLRRKAQIQRALNLDVLEKKEEARERLQALAEEKPDDIEGAFAYANILRAGKRYSEAAEAYAKIIKILGEPKREHWSLYYFRGMSYERAKQWTLAEKDFQLALKLSPDNPQVLNYLGYSWVDQGVNLDQALEMIRKAVSLRPKDGYIIDSLGWAYYRLGRFEEAAAELEKAIVLSPSDPTINDHLGDAYWKTDRKLEARFQWLRAVENKPEPEDLPKIEKKLKEGLADDPVPPRAEEQKNPDKG